MIGGLAGAIPPVLGWTAVTGELHAFALQLCLIIFVWTPPHFWALAIFRRDDYARAQVPMLPVTHGIVYTRWQVLFYTVLLVLVTLLPVITGYSGLVYLGGAVVLDAGFLYYAIRLIRPPDDYFPMRVFKYSIVYLMALFAFLLVDHWVLPTPHLIGLRAARRWADQGESRDGRCIEAGMRLLIAEDSPTLGRDLCSALVRDGHAVDVAADGEQAMQFLSSYSYDVATLDLMMPRVDGWAVLRWLQRRRAAPAGAGAVGA